MNSETSTQYFPPPESAGGWRYLSSPDDVRNLGGMDAAALEHVHNRQQIFHGGDSWSIVIIRHGHLVREFHTFNVLFPSRFDIWSCTKSFTATAWGLLFEDSRLGHLPGALQVDLNSKAYDFIPEGHPLTDPRKADITIGHLLTMTSGVAGEQEGIVGIPTATGVGPFEHSLGMADNRYGRSVGVLASNPGTRWDYSDPAMAHLAVAFGNITGREMSEFLTERVFNPIGIEELSWDVQGGSGAIGPHTNAHTGVHVSARELARFGYLMLHQGRWNDTQLVPGPWIDLATTTSQTMNPNYGHLWWVNTARSQWTGLPADAFAAIGYRSNRCYVVPSLDLVVARVGSGPSTWDEAELIEGIADAVVAN